MGVQEPGQFAPVVDREECTYCGKVFPYPVELHHDVAECRANAATAWMQDLPAVNVVKEGTRRTLTMQPLRVETLCRTYWGSHGCDLDVREPHEVHQCGTEDSTYGVCSQMRKTGPETAAVRFWITDLAGKEWRWGDWSTNWTWFA